MCPDKRNGPNERTDQSSRKNTTKQQRDNNLSDAEFKTLVIRKLTGMVECGLKIEEKVKAMLSEIKENVQKTSSEEREPGLK